LCSGRQCFTEFLLSKHYTETHPAACALICFLDAVKTLQSEKPVLALQKAQDFLRDHLEMPIIAELNLWGAKDDELFTTLHEQMSRLVIKAKEQAEGTHMFNIKEMYQPFVAAARDYLARKPWVDFKASRHWVRYCQWKHLELNMRVSEEDFDVCCMRANLLLARAECPMLPGVP